MNIVKGMLLVLLLAVAYLLLWPLPIEPLAWTPPQAPPRTDGVHADNEQLRGIQRIGSGIVGPEGIAFDAGGQLYAGLHDGRLLRIAPDLSSCVALDHSGGRPLGLTVLADNSLIIADARNGLLSLDAASQLHVLSRESDGQPFGFTNDVDSAPQSRQLYFTDASTAVGYGGYMPEAIAHGRNGRLLRHDLDSGSTTTLLRDLAFANGVAVGPDEAYVLVNETWEYRVTRYWLKGDQAGRSEPFADNLPGFPDNLSFNGRDRFWVALAEPRDALLDRVLPQPFVRGILLRLPQFLWPTPKRRAHVVALDLDGKVVASLQYTGDDAYAPITSVEERDGWLYFGSLERDSLGRIRVDEALNPSAGAVSLPEPLALNCP